MCLPSQAESGDLTCWARCPVAPGPCNRRTCLPAAVVRR